MPECHWIDAVWKNKRDGKSVRYLFASFVKQAPGKIWKYCKLLISKLSKSKNGTMFVIQDKYEVDLLREHMLNYNWEDPLKRMFCNNKKNNKEKRPIDPLFVKAIDNFSEKWFPGFKKQVVELFISYHENILCGLDVFYKNFEKKLQHKDPDALLYSVSSNRLYEDVCAYAAEKKDIPIFYFQHGGTQAFHFNPYQFHTELNGRHIKSINILHSKEERKIVKGNISLESKALGSGNLYNINSSDMKIKPSVRSRKVLYCPSPFNSYDYKDLMTNVPDSMLFDIHNDVLENAIGLDLDMDIKVHPCDERHTYVYFMNLLEEKESANMDVLKGFSAEKILPQYGLMILDYLGTALFPVSSVMRIPTIIYLKDMSALRQETLSDLYDRYHVVRNKEELKKALDLHARGELDTKFSLPYIDKYSFPIDDGYPCKNINNFIMAKIADRKGVCV